MECVYEHLVQLDEIFNIKEKRTRLFDNLSNRDQGLQTVSKDLPWEVLKNLNLSLPLNEKLKICEDAVRENVINLYQKLITRLLSAIQHDTFDKSWKRDVYEGIFIKGCHAESIIVLCRVLQNTEPSDKLDIILSILEKFVVGPSLSELFFQQCYFSTNKSNSITKNVPNPMWGQLLSYLVSLPDRIANKLKGKIKYPFDKESYVQLSSEAIINVLSETCLEVSHGHNMCLEFLSQFLGRMCLSGYGESIFKIITPKLLSECKSNFIWRKASSRMIVGVPDRCLEIVLNPLLSNIPWYGYVKYFLGERLVKPTLKFLITKKFILIRHFDEPTILQNCIGYLAQDELHEGHTLFLELVRYILESWADGMSLHYLSYEQHFNWSAALAMSAGYLKLVDFQLYKQEYLKLLLEGVQLHISSSIPAVRVQGMVIGRLLTSILDPKWPKLDFEYEETAEVKKLIAYMKIPDDPKEIENDTETCKNNFTQILSPADINIPNPDENNTVESNDTEDIDSDDDLETYDQSNDVKMTETKAPLYIRDCLQGLVDHSDPIWSESCLENALVLIKTQISSTKEIAEEMAKVLLHLDNNFSCNEFASLRFKALVAVLVISPEEVAKYLTNQFYDRNYSIRQRLDILEVLAVASQELSGVRNIVTKPVEESVLPRSNQNDPSSWKEIVRKRLDSKTRIISQGVSKETLPATENQFPKVAGCFFFPLLNKYDSKQNSFDLLGEDSYLLGRLIYTLGVLINSCSNSLVVKKLAKYLLEFLWVFRYHVEVFVRHSLLFAFSMVLINVPPVLLFTEMQSELFEFRSWLQDVLSHDIDNECRRISAQILALMSKTFNEVIELQAE